GSRNRLFARTGSLRETISLIGEEKPRPVFSVVDLGEINRASKSCAEVITVEDRFRPAKLIVLPRIRIESLRLVIVEERAMHLVGTGLCGDADIAAAGTAVLGFERGGLDAKLLHGVHRWCQPVHVAHLVAPALFYGEAIHADVPIVLLAAANLEIVPGALTVTAFYL